MRRAIHPSHRMGKEFSDVRTPAGTPRFYGVRQCIACKGEEIAHPAGAFTDDELARPCTAAGGDFGERTLAALRKIGKKLTSEGKAKIRSTPKPKRRRSRT